MHLPFGANNNFAFWGKKLSSKIVNFKYSYKIQCFKELFLNLTNYFKREQRLKQILSHSFNILCDILWSTHLVGLSFIYYSFISPDINLGSLVFFMYKYSACSQYNAHHCQIHGNNFFDKLEKIKYVFHYWVHFFTYIVFLKLCPFKGSTKYSYSSVHFYSIRHSRQLHRMKLCVFTGYRE
jgi:hypothetical protein